MPSRAAQTLTQYLLVDCIATTGQLYSKIRTRSSWLLGLHRHEFIPVGGVARGHQLASHLPGRALPQAASAQADGPTTVFGSNLFEQCTNVFGLMR